MTPSGSSPCSTGSLTLSTFSWMTAAITRPTCLYTALDERHPAATVIVPPAPDAVLSATADTDPTQRDRHIQAIANRGRMTWQRNSGYNQRAEVEASSPAASRSSVTGCVSTATRPAPLRSRTARRLLGKQR